MEPTIEELARRVAESHSFDVHVIRDGEFKEPLLGPVIQIETREELKAHVVDVLESNETLCFSAFPTEQIWRRADIFYHPPTNTMIVIPDNPLNEPTVYRPEKGQEALFQKVKEVQSIEDRAIEISRGIHELHPQLSADRAREQEEERLRKIAEEHLEKLAKAREEGRGRTK